MARLGHANGDDDAGWRSRATKRVRRDVVTEAAAGERSTGINLFPFMFQAFACSMAMMSFVALAGPVARTLRLEPWHLGITMTVAGIGWMVMSRIWGSTSDRHGRRPILLLGVGAFALAYLLLSVFIDVALRLVLAPTIAFAGIALGRCFAGIFYAAAPATTMALVADHVPAERRAAAMATVGAASAAGMVVGPGFVGLAAPFGLSLPLYATAALPFLAFILLWRVVPREQASPSSAGSRPGLFDPRLRRAMTVAFLAMFSVSAAQITVGFFALDRLRLPSRDAASAAGMALALVGVALVCAQTILRKLDWSPTRFIGIGCLIGAAGFASVTLASSPFMLWASFAVAAFGMGWVYPSLSALAANSVQPHEQGAAAGSMGAAQGFGTIVGPMAGTLAYTADPRLPYALMALLLVFAAGWSNWRARAA